MKHIVTLEVTAALEGVTVPEIIVKVLNETANLNEAAARLGVSYRTLYRYIREYNIQAETRYTVLGTLEVSA